jgi:hypothetical protein
MSVSSHGQARADGAHENSGTYPALGPTAAAGSRVGTNERLREQRISIVKTFGLIVDNGSDWYIQGNSDDGWNAQAMKKPRRGCNGVDCASADDKTLRTLPSTGIRLAHRNPPRAGVAVQGLRRKE